MGWAGGSLGEGVSVGRGAGRLLHIFEHDTLLYVLFFLFFLHISEKYNIYTKYLVQNNGYSTE